MKILIIDQDPATLEKLQTSLTRADYQVLMAADSDIGLRLAREDQPDLIILDILLTGLDGLEVTQQLKQDESTKNIPIVLITSLSIPAKNEPWQPTPQSKWQLLRYHDYLPKPVDTNHLVRKIDALLKPETAATKQTGPGVCLLTQDALQLAAIQQAMLEANFEITCHTELKQALSAIYTYHPASLVVDGDFLSAENALPPIKRFQERHPTFSLIVLQNKASTVPLTYLDQIDWVINQPVQPWQVVRAVQKSLQHRNLEIRVGTLSKQVLTLSGDLVDTKHTLQYQNQELDLINRKLHQLSEVKETLTGMLVHDLKAPLTAIMGSLQFLTMDPNNTISENSQKIVSGGLAAAQQMLRMTHTLLDEHKLENNQLVFDIEPVELEEPFETSVEMLSPLLNMHKVTVETSLDEDLRPVMADPIILQRVIENLLDNAIKYSPTNEVITLKAVRKDDFVEICIADRGEGIPPEHRDIVFDRFTQLQDPRIEKIRGGVGLGLAFCKLAVEAMGGKIWVDSLGNVGTAFFFTMPLAAEEA